MKNWLLVILAAGLLAAPAVLAKVGGGDITFSVTGANDVVYSHDLHVIKAGLKCTGCHYGIFNTNEARKDVTMAEMQKGRSCGACHNGQKAFTVKANCDKCHK